MKKYKTTIKSFAKKRLKKVREDIEEKLKEIDNTLLENLVDLAIEGKLDDGAEEAREKAQKAWKEAKAIAREEVEEAMSEAWMEIRRAKVRYRKYKINGVKSIAKKVVSLTTSLARLVASNGADLAAYVTLGKSIVGLASDIKTLLTSPETVAQNLSKELSSYQKIHSDLQNDKTSVILQGKLAKVELGIRTNIKLLMDKTAGLAEKASKLGVKIDKLKETKEKIQEHEELLKGKKLNSIDKNVKKMEEAHSKFVERYAENNEILETAKQVYASKDPALILQAKEKLEEAFTALQTAKTVITKVMDIAETIGVF